MLPAAPSWLDEEETISIDVVAVEEAAPAPALSALPLAIALALVLALEADAPIPLGPAASVDDAVAFTWAAEAPAVGGGKTNPGPSEASR